MDNNELQEQIKHEPGNVRLINDLAISYMMMNRYEDAFYQFKKAADILPNVQTLNNLAYFYFHEGEPIGKDGWRYKENEAILLLEKVMYQNPSSHFPYSLLGEIYMNTHQYNLAIDILHKAIEIQPTLENLNNVGVCYYNNSCLEKATEYFYKACLLRKEENESLNPLLSYGICIAKQGKREESLQIAEKLLLLNQKLNDGNEAEIAYIYYILGEYSEFVKIYSELNLFHYSVEWMPPYLFALEETGEINRMKEIVDRHVSHKKNEIREALQEEDSMWEHGRREEYIEETQMENQYLRDAAEQIIEGNRPSIEYEPQVEKGCYLFGCKIHQHPYEQI